MKKFIGDLYPVLKTQLKSPKYRMKIARFWAEEEISGDELVNVITDELTQFHEGRLWDWNGEELDLLALRPSKLFGSNALKTMKTLEQFSTYETIEVYDLFGVDEGRTMNRLREMLQNPPTRALSAALVPRFMMLDFAMRIRLGRYQLHALRGDAAA